MRKCLLLIIAILIIFIIAGCKKKSTGENSQEISDEVVKKIDYIKDPRTNVCFAYMWGGAGNGGPALATVPCDVIPLTLLRTAILK